jgi:hypothetical protein
MKLVIENDNGVEFVDNVNFDDYYFEGVDYKSKNEVINEFMKVMNDSFGNDEYMNEIKECMKNLDNVDGKWFIGFGDEGMVSVGVV